jgi:hypothetical protein
MNPAVTTRQQLPYRVVFEVNAPSYHLAVEEVDRLLDNAVPDDRRELTLAFNPSIVGAWGDNPSLVQFDLVYPGSAAELLDAIAANGEDVEVSVVPLPVARRMADEQR